VIASKSQDDQWQVFPLELTFELAFSINHHLAPLTPELVYDFVNNLDCLACHLPIVPTRVDVRQHHKLLQLLDMHFAVYWPHRVGARYDSLHEDSVMFRCRDTANPCAARWHCKFASRQHCHSETQPPLVQTLPPLRENCYRFNRCNTCGQQCTTVHEMIDHLRHHPHHIILEGHFVSTPERMQKAIDNQERHQRAIALCIPAHVDNEIVETKGSGS